MTQEPSVQSFERRGDTNQPLARNKIPTLPELNTESDAETIDGAHANCASRAGSHPS